MYWGIVAGRLAGWRQRVDRSGAKASFEDDNSLAPLAPLGFSFPRVS